MPRLSSSSSLFLFFSLLFTQAAAAAAASTGWSDSRGWWCLPPPFHTLRLYTLAEVPPQPRAYFTQGLYPSHTGFSKDQTAGTFRSMDLVVVSRPLYFYANSSLCFRGLLMGFP
ncbi:hypothetical protein HDV64DRAFT_23529 [Trichoderma sp. TUCIM 5745]